MSVSCVSRLPPVSLNRYRYNLPTEARLFCMTVSSTGTVRTCRARLHFADRLRAGAGRRSGSGWRQGRVRRGRPLLSPPRGAVDSGLAAVLAAVESVAVFVRVCVFGFGWMVVRFVRVIRVPACARVSRVSRVCPGSPRCLFTGTVPVTIWWEGRRD